MAFLNPEKIIFYCNLGLIFALISNYRTKTLYTCELRRCWSVQLCHVQSVIPVKSCCIIQVYDCFCYTSWPSEFILEEVPLNLQRLVSFGGLAATHAQISQYMGSVSSISWKIHSKNSKAGCKAGDKSGSCPHANLQCRHDLHWDSSLRDKEKKYKPHQWKVSLC